MAEEDDAPRKKRVRGDHHASVTRLISQLEEAMESDDARRLKQLKQSLTDKTSVLVKLDDELIGLVEEEQLEAEVEQADLIRERIGLAIISIEDALKALVAKTPETGRGDKKGPHRKDTRAERSPVPRGRQNLVRRGNAPCHPARQAPQTAMLTLKLLHVHLRWTPLLLCLLTAHQLH